MPWKAQIIYEGAVSERAWRHSQKFKPGKNDKKYSISQLSPFCRREIAMQRLKRFGAAMICVAAIGCIFGAGYVTGRNRNIKRELNASIPVNVLIYKTIKRGEPEQAATMMSLILMGKVERYDALKNDRLFQVAGGEGLTVSTRLQESLSEARRIVAEQKTNLVTILPPNQK